MANKRNASIAAIIVIALGVLHPHALSQGLPDVAQIGAVCHKWHHHWAGSALLIALICWLLAPPRGGH